MTQPHQDITLPDGEIITEPDGPLISISVSSPDPSLDGEESGVFRELPLRIPSSSDGDATRKVPTPMA
jgi:hypothetical protein